MNSPANSGAGWTADRRRLAAMALVVAMLTASADVWSGQSPKAAFGSLAYMATVVAALYSPAWITVQVIGGQIIAASLLLGPGAIGPIAVMPVVAAVIATAELLAAASRLDLPFARVTGDEVRRTIVVAATGAVVFGGVAFAGGVTGPTGLIAVTIASAGCLLLAVLLVGRAPRT